MMQKLIVTFEVSGHESAHAIESKQQILAGALKNATNEVNRFLAAEDHTLRLKLIGSEISE